MKELLTPNQVAKAIGVSESSLKRWADQGRIAMVRTAGGHRRLPVSNVLDFVRQQGLELVDATILGLPSATGTGARTLQRGLDSLIDAFRRGSYETALRVCVDLYLVPYSLADIFDQVFQPAMKAVGHQWETGQMEVYEERRSVEFVSRVLHELSRMQPPVDSCGPKAIGGTLDGDPYTTAGKMADLVLRSVGYRSVSLGNELPFETLGRALEIERPALFWLSVSSIRDVENFTGLMRRFGLACRDQNCLLVIGGQALTEEVRRDLVFDGYCDKMTTLETFARDRVQSLIDRQLIG